jgi:hypothetical protein
MLALWVARRRSLDLVAWEALLVFMVVGLTLFAGYIQFNKAIGYQPRARYFFIMLLPGALLLTGGLYALVAKRALRVAAVGILFIALGFLNASALVTVSEAGVAKGGVRQHFSIRH